MPLPDQVGRLYTAPNRDSESPNCRYREGHRAMDRRFWILAVAVLLKLASGDVAAQAASPAASDFVTPDPADCTVAPRSVAELHDFIAAAGGATPAPASPIPAGGEPADAETTAAVSAVTHEI